jgi:Type III flagellar switch regulator (C-ring) FliN C-term
MMDLNPRSLNKPDERCLHAWSTRQIESLVRRLSTIAEDWRLAWGFETGSDLQTLAGDLTVPEAGVGCWALLQEAQHAPAQAWINAPSGLDLELGRLLFGADGQDGIAREVAGVARSDLMLRLHGFFAGAGASTGLPQRAGQREHLWPVFEAAAQRLWSGALGIELRLDGHRLSLLLGGDLVAMLLPLAPPSMSADAASDSRPVALREALARQTVDLRVCLNDVELSLGSLGNLHSGDVLRLSHTVDQPLAVLGPSGATVCLGWLGGRAGQRALQLAPRQEVSHFNKNQE